MKSLDFGIHCEIVRKASRFLSFTLLLVFTGCNSGPIIVEEEMSETQARLLSISNAFLECTRQTGRPPNNEKDLKRFLKVENSDEVLVSPRDGLPFVICYGVNVNDESWAKPGTTPVFAYEQHSEGPRWVLCPPGIAFEIEADEFSQASFPPGHRVQR